MAPELIYLDKERIKLRGDKSLKGAEKLAELEWLLDGGVFPAHAATQLGTNVGALTKLARDHDRLDLARRIALAGTRRDVLREHWRAA